MKLFFILFTKNKRKKYIYKYIIIIQVFHLFPPEQFQSEVPINIKKNQNRFII